MSTEIESRFANIESRIRAIEELIPPPMVTAEPAPGSDAERPPVGYVLLPKGSLKRIEKDWDWIHWAFDEGPWTPMPTMNAGDVHHECSHPIARPIPANEGDSRLAESVAIPVGWVLGFPEGANFRYWCKDETGGGFWGTTARTCVTVRDLMIVPDPSIPWGEGYEAILPSEARCGDEYRDRHQWKEWTHPNGETMANATSFVWRRRIPAATPTEPARDLSDKIAESVVQDLQQACYDRAELRATVERLTAENASLEVENRTLRGLVRRMKEVLL